jgi:hypothetical protein
MRYAWTVDEFEWALARVLDVIHEARGSEGAWEETIYSTVIDQNKTEWWTEKSRGLRATIVSEGIAMAVANNTIHPVAGKTQATGRRCFRLTDPLVRVAEAL